MRWVGYQRAECNRTHGRLFALWCPGARKSHVAAGVAILMVATAFRVKHDVERIALSLEQFP